MGPGLPQKAPKTGARLVRNGQKWKGFLRMLGQDKAETIALQALGWLVGNDDLRPVFMGATGIDENDLRLRAGEAEFLGSVLDFLLMDDAWVVACCDAMALPYDQLMQARAALPGGQQVHWT